MITIVLILILYRFGCCCTHFQQPIQAARIVGGKNADIANFRYQVAMFENEDFRCGGSVIAKNWIITAAHCLQGNITISTITFRIGSSNYNYGGEIVNAAEIFNHPEYVFTLSTMYNDVALVRTVQHLVGNYVRAIKLPKINYEINSINKYGIISGWGYLQSDIKITPSNLQYVIVNIIDKDLCSKKFSIHGIGIHDSMFCAVDVNKDACQGESGGPFVVDGMLVGIISWGVGCADSLPGVYTYLAYPPIRNWIKKISQI